MKMPAILAALVLPIAFLTAAVQANEEDTSRWDELRAMLFADRPIEDGAGFLTLDAPRRAHDAAVVPIEFSAAFPHHPDRYIKTVTLLIDENPLPVAGHFHFTPESGRAAFATRVRVNSYTPMRAIAETSDGELFMVERFVKASGGCSAPAGKDPDAALARLGKMKLRQSQPVWGEPNRAQILVSHPNHTGMQMDQVTHYYVPAHFVEQIEVRYDDAVVMRVESNFSLSEDPSLHFFYVPDHPGQLSVTVTDSEDQIFARSWPVPEISS